MKVLILKQMEMDQLLQQPLYLMELFVKYQVSLSIRMDRVNKFKVKSLVILKVMPREDRLVLQELLGLRESKEIEDYKETRALRVNKVFRAKGEKLALLDQPQSLILVMVVHPL